MGVYTSAKSPFDTDDAAEWWEKYNDQAPGCRDQIKAIATEIEAERLRLNDLLESGIAIPPEISAQLSLSGGVDGFVFSLFLEKLKALKKQVEFGQERKDERRRLTGPMRDRSVDLASISEELRNEEFFKVAREIKNSHRYGDGYSANGIASSICKRIKGGRFHRTKTVKVHRYGNVDLDFDLSQNRIRNILGENRDKWESDDL